MTENKFLEFLENFQIKYFGLLEKAKEKESRQIYSIGN